MAQPIRLFVNEGLQGSEELARNISFLCHSWLRFSLIPRMGVEGRKGLMANNNYY